MIEIIPAIDIIDGKCVRLSQGDYNSQKTYSKQPLEIARMFEANGIKRLHLVDLDGAKSNHIVNHRVLEEIAGHTSLIIDFGGGIKSLSDLEIAFQSGAEKVTIGSVAVTQPENFLSWLQLYGSERIILGADVKEERIVTHGWMSESNTRLIPFIKQYQEAGINQVLCTDISYDGMLKGPSIKLYKKILETFPFLYLIASGGISSINDIKQLENNQVPAVVVGKAIYENRISIKELSQYIAKEGRI